MNKTNIMAAQSLPSMAYVPDPYSEGIAVLYPGNDVYYSARDVPEAGKAARMTADKAAQSVLEGICAGLNAEKGVTRGQAAAMATGPVYGWDSVFADPKYYDEDGRFTG